MKKFDSFDKLAEFFNNPDPFNGTRVWGSNTQTLEFSEVCNPTRFDSDTESVKNFVNNNQKETNDRSTT